MKVSIILKEIKDFLKLSNIIIILALTCVWILLREEFSVVTVLPGLLFAAAAHFFCCRALPTNDMSDVRFMKLATYPLFLIGQVYLAGFHVIKLIFTGADAEIIQVKTNLESESLRIVLVDSVTLTPGSVLIRLEGNEFTLLWLKAKGSNPTVEEREESLKGALERRLITAQK